MPKKIGTPKSPNVAAEMAKQAPRPVQKTNSAKQLAARKGFRRRAREGYA